MIDIRSQTLLIVRRRPPTTLPVRAQREIDEHCAPFCTSGRSISPRSPAVSALCSVTPEDHASQETNSRNPRSLRKLQENVHRNFVQPEF